METNNINFKYGVSDSQLLSLVATSGVIGLNVPILKAILEVEAIGKGFDYKTDKILIQFEPLWFKRLFPRWIYFSKKVWENNGVDVQSKEWLAFNEAFSADKDKAMESTSIGMPQIMGFHFKRLGFNSVGQMWDYFKVSEYNQVQCLIRFIKTDSKLIKAVSMLNSEATLFSGADLFASVYNGSGYKKLAKKLGTVPYDEKIVRAVQKYNKKK